MLPSPQGRPGYPLTSKAKAKHEGRPRRRFSPGPEMCVPSPETPRLSIQIFSTLLLAFFFFLILVPLFSFHFFSFFAVSPERFDLYFGCYPLLPLTFKTLHLEVFSPFLAFSCLLFLGC